VRAAELLEGPGLPLEAAYLWGWFLELSVTRPAGGLGGGPSAIAYTEMLAWAQLTGRRPAPWEVEWLGHLDRVWMAGNEKHEKAKPAGGGKP
jgi:hypothetical protein